MYRVLPRFSLNRMPMRASSLPSKIMDRLSFLNTPVRVYIGITVFCFFIILPFSIEFWNPLSVNHFEVPSDVDERLAAVLSFSIIVAHFLLDHPWIFPFPSGTGIQKHCHVPEHSRHYFAPFPIGAGFLKAAHVFPDKLHRIDKTDIQRVDFVKFAGFRHNSADSVVKGKKGVSFLQKRRRDSCCERSNPERHRRSPPDES